MNLRNYSLEVRRMSFRLLLLIVLISLFSQPAFSSAASPGSDGVPILLYHRFGPTVADGMTIKTTVFEEHLRYLRDNGYKVIPLRQLVDWRLRKGPPPLPSRW